MLNSHEFFARNRAEDFNRKLKPPVLLGIILLHVGALAAIPYGVRFGFTWLSIVVMLVYVILTGLGVSVFYHRLLTHQSFKIKVPFLEYFGTYFGGVAGQNAYTWVLNHRSHHEFGDTKDDPYAVYWPYRGGWRGFWWAHIAALVCTFERPAKYASLSGDDPHKDVILWEAKYHALIFFSGFFIPGLIAGWDGLWLAFARVVYVFHITWLVNSLCHIWGCVATLGVIPGRNSPLVINAGYVGEGFHKNHHLDPISAYLGWKWWHLDLGKWTILLFERLGWVSDVRRPRAVSLQSR